MRAHGAAIQGKAATAKVRDRILGGLGGSRDPALIFAASSIINEISGPDASGITVQREVRTDTGLYRLIGSRVSGPDGQQPVVVIFAEPEQNLGEQTPTARDRLSRKEARVAALLAAQKTNEEIAKTLCISTHTARHHTQSVLSKLGIKSRRDVARVMAGDRLP